KDLEMIISFYEVGTNWNNIVTFAINNLKVRVKRHIINVFEANQGHIIGYCTGCVLVMGKAACLSMSIDPEWICGQFVFLSVGSFKLNVLTSLKSGCLEGHNKMLCWIVFSSILVRCFF